MGDGHAADAGSCGEPARVNVRGKSFISTGNIRIYLDFDLQDNHQNPDERDQEADSYELGSDFNGEERDGPEFDLDHEHDWEHELEYGKGPELYEEAPELSSDDDAHSDYSVTNADEEKKIAEHNRVAAEVPWVPEIPSVEEEDEDLDEQYAQETGGKSKGAKSKASDQKSDGGDKEQEHVDNDDDTPDGPVTPWHLTPGPLSSAHLKEAMAAQAAYYATLEDVARRSGKKLSSIFKAIGDYPKATREVNSWNAFEMMYRTEHPKNSKSMFAVFCSFVQLTSLQ